MLILLSTSTYISHFNLVASQLAPRRPQSQGQGPRQASSSMERRLSAPRSVAANREVPVKPTSEADDEHDEAVLAQTALPLPHHSDRRLSEY